MRLILMVSILTIILSIGCLERGKTVVMNLKELTDDIDSYVYNERLQHSEQFKTLEPGDTLIIRDTVSEVRVPAENATLILFESEPTGGFSFDGNLSSYYQVGDNIEITLHIKSDSFKKANSTNVIWSYNIEIFEEGWDFIDHLPLLLPSNTIKKI